MILHAILVLFFYPTRNHIIDFFKLKMYNNCRISQIICNIVVLFGIVYYP